MSGLSDMLGGIEDWAKSIPGAAKQVNQDVANYIGSLPGAVEGVQRDYQQNVSGPAAHWFGLYGLAQRDEAGKTSAQGDPQALPADEADIGGKKYKFKEVGATPGGMVKDYEETTPLPYGPTPGNQRQKMAGQLEQVLGGVQNPGDISPNEYAKLTKAASKGNKLAQRILVEGRFKARDFPSLTQDLAKVADPFVKALSNLPNVANSAEAQVAAVTKPYDFSNAEGQVNNILANQGFAQTAQPSAATSAYVGKLDQIASGNPLTTSTLGLPTIDQALAGLGPAAKISEKAAPTSALLGALLSHLQYQDIYGTGLSTTAGARNNPAWLQALLQSVNASSGLGGALPSVSSLTGTTPTTSAPGSTTSPVPSG